jgi:hypothetical protein
METVDLLIVLPVSVSAYLASLLCRFAKWLERAVYWYFGLVGAMSAGVFMIPFIALDFSIQPGQTPYLFFCPGFGVAASLHSAASANCDMVL